MKTEFIQTPNGWEHLTYHPLSEVVGFGVGIDVDALAKHIADHGYDDQESIVIYRDGKIDCILDGRHKHAACVIAGVTPTFRRFVGSSPEAYIAKKAFRQHLSTSQRAMIAAVISNGKNGDNQHTKKEGTANAAPSKSQQNAANTLNISKDSLQRAKKVEEKGTAEIKAGVVDGTVKVADAAKIVDCPPDLQNAALTIVKEGKAKTLVSAVKIAKADAEKQDEPEIEEPKDDNGEIWKDKAPKAIKALEAAGPLREMSRQLAGMIRQIEENESLRLYTYSMQSVIAAMKTTKETLLGAIPSYVCPYCDGTTKTLEGPQKDKGCEVCQRQGWVTKSTYRRSPKGQAVKT